MRITRVEGVANRLEFRRNFGRAVGTGTMSKQAYCAFPIHSLGQETRGWTSWKLVVGDGEIVSPVPQSIMDRDPQAHDTTRHDRILF